MIATAGFQIRVKFVFRHLRMTPVEQEKIWVIKFDIFVLVQPGYFSDQIMTSFSEFFFELITIESDLIQNPNPTRNDKNVLAFAFLSISVSQPLLRGPKVLTR